MTEETAVLLATQMGPTPLAPSLAVLAVLILAAAAVARAATKKPAAQQVSPGVPVSPMGSSSAALGDPLHEPAQESTFTLHGPTVDPLWGPMEVLGAEPALGPELGYGGQGIIYAVTDHPDRVYKRLAIPIPADLKEFERFVGLGESLRTSLSDAGVALVWPEAPHVEGGLIIGYEMPRIPAGYTLTIGGTVKEAQLQYAVPKDGPFRPDLVPNLHERIELVRSVGSFLASLHSFDYVYGDISWLNILYRLTPHPGILVLDMDCVRRLGARPVLSTKPLNSPCFGDHDQSTELGQGFDSDRYKFALLVHRMIVSLHISAPLDPAAAIGEDADLQPATLARIKTLLYRAANPPGTRPAIAEWLDALAPLKATDMALQRPAQD